MYPKAVTSQRDMLDMDLRSHEGLTYKWYSGKFSGPALWEFGYGLSYTNFTYQWMESHPNLLTHASTTAMASQAQDSLSYAVNVTNTGPYAGATTVLGFIEGGDGVTRPFRALFGFEKIWLEAGSSATVVLTTTAAAAFSAVDEAGRKVLKPGAYHLAMGDLERPARHHITLVGKEVVLAEYLGDEHSEAMLFV